MKLKSILICILIGCGLALQAQDYKVIGIESLPTDMTARKHIVKGPDDKECAVFRIVTQNISPEMREGFHFECDLGSYVAQKSVIDGEIRVWVSSGLKVLKIKHSQLGPWELHIPNYGIEVEALHTYKIVIQGKASGKQEVKQQYLAFQISPADAELEVDGEIWPLSSRGTARRRVNEGTYHYKLSALGYENEENMVTVVDSALVVTVNLKPVSKKPTPKQPKAETIQPKVEKKPKKEQPTTKKESNGNVFFVMANAAYSIAPQTSFGLTVGSVKRWGWYASFGTNFKFSKSDYEYDFECDGNGQMATPIGEYVFNNEQKTCRLAATAGMVIRISDPIYAYVGGGYGLRQLFWSIEINEYIDGYYGPNIHWVKNTDYSYQGIALDAGLMLHFKGFGFSIGLQTIKFNYLEAKIGIGYTLKNK